MSVFSNFDAWRNVNVLNFTVASCVTLTGDINRLLRLGNFKRLTNPPHSLEARYHRVPLAGLELAM